MVETMFSCFYRVSVIFVPLKGATAQLVRFSIIMVVSLSQTVCHGLDKYKSDCR